MNLPDAPIAHEGFFVTHWRAKGAVFLTEPLDNHRCGVATCATPTATSSKSANTPGHRSSAPPSTPLEWHRRLKLSSAGLASKS